MPRRQRIGKSAWSVFGRIEEIVLSSSGADAFELVLSLAVARLFLRGKGRRLDASSAPRLRRSVDRALAAASRAWPGIEPSRELAVPDDVLVLAVKLLDEAGLDADAEGLDALFERLVTRVGKGQKGQFFTPRHVVDLATAVLGLAKGERFVDPACGSGAFVSHARSVAAVDGWGFDVDGRAVRVAKLLAVATGADPGRIVRRDSLGAAGLAFAAKVDAIATNPPFAGTPDATGFEVARLGGRVERDSLFLERCVSLLRPDGRLAIVLPHGKASAPAWSALRRWFVHRARVFAVVSLPRETFLPNTSQRTVLLVAKKRRRPVAVPDPTERVFLGVSEKAGRDAAGEPTWARGRAPAEGRRATWRDHDHDLGTLRKPLLAFLGREGFGT